MQPAIPAPQVRSILQSILDFVVSMIMFLLSMVIALWLITVLEPSNFATWFLH